MAKEIIVKYATRQEEIMRDFLFELEKHLAELKDGKALKTFEINDLAALLHIHPTHLSNTIKEATGKSPCDFYEEKLMAIAKQLLADKTRTISDIAYSLTFDPSNFTKFFRRFEGKTPKQYRQTLL